jgi:chorismate mutase-like protein
LSTLKCLASCVAARAIVALRCLSIALVACAGCNPVVQSNQQARPTAPSQATSVNASADSASTKSTIPANQQHLTELLSLISDRLDLMPGVAQAKWNRKLAITDAKRETILLDGLQAKGTQRGLPADVVREFFLAQITAAKVIQEQHFADWTARQQPPFPQPPDLEREIRPKIDKLNEQMLDALTQIWQERSSLTKGDIDRASSTVFERSRETPQHSKEVTQTALKFLRVLVESRHPIP